MPSTTNSGDPHAQLNGLIQHDQQKNSVKVHSFNPDASPQEKAAAAGKGRDQLKNINEVHGGESAGAREVAIDTGKGPAVNPTIVVSHADEVPVSAPSKDKTPVPPTSSNGQPVPGSIPAGPAPAIPDWYKVGWRSVGGIDDPPLEEGEEKDKGLIDRYLGEQFYGAWYHNAAIIFFAVFASHFLTLFGLGWAWLFLVLAACSTYYSTSMTRVRRRARDDIQRELVKTRLVSEHESADWINNFLDRFWLIYEPVLSATVVSSIDQILSTNTPAFLDSIRLSTFTLGTKAPRIDKVRTFPRTAEDIVIMDWALSFTPNDVSDITPREASKKVNPKIVLTIRFGKGVATASMPILLEDINFTGHLRIRLKLMTNFPHVQVVDISFLEKPIFDYVLKPIGGETFGFDVGNIPGLSAFIRDMVHATLGPMMYDPNVFTLNLEQLLSGAPLDAAIGVLQVTVDCARGLKGAKIGGGTPDPYVSLNINNRAELARTKYKHRTYNPTWRETKYLLINSLNESLVFAIYDYNDHRKDSDMGAATFDLSKLQDDATQEGIETKILKDGKERGNLRFDVEFYPVLKPQKIDGGKEEALPDTKVGIVRLTLHQAKDLDHTKSLSGDLNPFAKVLLGANPTPVHTTARFKHTNNPVWESATEFLCTEKASSVVTVKIVDDRDFLKDPLVGYMSIKLADLLDSNQTAGKDWWPLSGCKSGRIRMTAEWKPLNMAGSLRGADQYIPPIGIVRLWVQKAIDIKNVEAALGGKSDPYVRVQVDNVTMGRTEVINNNLSPEWDQIIYIPVHSLKETMLLECMDYQHLTKDRSLGSVELRISDLAKESDGSEYPYASTGKKAAADPLRLDKGNVYKGTLHYVAEFVPALALRNVHFAAGPNEIQQAAERREGDAQTDEGSSVSSSDEEREAVPVGITIRKPIDENAEYHPRHTKGAKSTDTTNSTETADTTETAQTAPTDSGIEMAKEELLRHQSGVIVFNVRSGQLYRKARLEVLLDDGYWPAFTTVRARSTNAQWDHVGEGFIKELDFGRVWFRLNENEEGDKDDIIGEFKCDAKAFLEQAMDKPTKYTLTDVDGKHPSVLEIEARYVPVDITLEPRESINNQGILRVELIGGQQIRGIDRGGKSDPFVVFTLNDQKIFKSQTKKKTLTPEWNEDFQVSIPSRVGADFTLEVFDWNQIESAKSLGIAKIELASLEPFQRSERIVGLTSEKHGEQGHIRLSLLFTPEIIAKTRKNTSTFSSAGRAMTQIGSLPVGAGKGVFHGVGTVGKSVQGVFKKDYAKPDGTAEVEKTAPEPPSSQVSAPIGVSDSTSSNGTATFPTGNVSTETAEAHIPSETGTLRVTVLSAKDLSSGGSDSVKPYVVLKVGDKEHKTKHAGKTLVPEWNESFIFAAGPSTPKLHACILDHKTLGKDKSLGEAEVDIWRHIQGGMTGADVWVELREGQGLLRLQLEFDAGNVPVVRGSSSVSLDRGPVGSPSRFSLRRRPGTDE